MSEELVLKYRPSCANCGKRLGVGFYYSCIVCGKAYCYAHAPLKCDHK